MPRTTTPRAPTIRRRAERWRDGWRGSAAASCRAATGGIVPARQAGTIAAARVTRVPATRPNSTVRGLTTSPLPGRLMPSPARPALSATARPRPAITPTADAIRPMIADSPRTVASTWPLLAPTARSRASSRCRCATTIVNVLKMTNTPTNSAMKPNASRKSPDAYVRRILINENRTRFRRRRVRELSTGSPPETGVPDALRRVDDRSALLAALQALAPRQRAVIVLRYWLDLSETETAATLNCSVGTVKSQASRALAALRRSPGLATLAEGDVR